MFIALTCYFSACIKFHPGAPGYRIFTFYFLLFALKNYPLHAALCLMSWVWCLSTELTAFLTIYNLGRII
jgi:hypothetical protein